jgi:hypothetical protein
MTHETEDKTRTRNGFVRGMHLSAEQIEGILAGIAAGGREGEVCRQYDTSFTQLIRRVRSEPELFLAYRKADLEKHRARALALRHERDRDAQAEPGNSAGIHEVEVPE